MDADLRAIYRRRRQAGRCVRCGADASRAVLCGVCRVDWRYCPACEKVYPAAAAYTRTTERWRRASELCRRCRKQRYDTTKHLTGYPPRSSIPHPRLREMIAHWRAGATSREIARALDMNFATLRSAINHARIVGHWPADLRRGKGWRKGRKAA